MASFAPGLAAVGAGAALFGGGDGGGGPFFARRQVFQTPAFQLGTSLSGGISSATLTRRGSEAQTQLEERFPRALGDIDVLREGIAPGFSQIREARREAVRAGLEGALSDVSETVAQRRLGGSSLAQNLELQARRTFASEEARQISASFIEELGTNVEILGAEFALLGQQLDREFAELGLTSEVGTQFTQLLNQGLRLQQQLASQEATANAQGLGQIAGRLIGNFLPSRGPSGPESAFTSLATSLFG